MVVNRKCLNVDVAGDAVEHALRLCRQANEYALWIATGGQKGMYSVAGQSICRLLNPGADEHGVACTALDNGSALRCYREQGWM
ncbi:hypothetical protein DBR00_19840 [Pseudomonas sp. HMWF032]|nr:hypothetical protein DBR00_19840 [Pseudomonas sp. HMWF032]PTT72724.1 hypothetical protein DBR41_29220 [Pseudomonas sp. HMWF010]